VAALSSKVEILFIKEAATLLDQIDTPFARMAAILRKRIKILFIRGVAAPWIK
jgi:hypothetical protein